MMRERNTDGPRRRLYNEGKAYAMWIDNFLTLHECDKQPTAGGNGIRGGGDGLLGAGWLAEMAPITGKAA